MRVIALGAAALAATFTLAGCSTEPVETAVPNNIPNKTATTPTATEDPSPVLEALGESWKKSSADVAPVSLCEAPVLPDGTSESAVVTDPEGRVVHIEFIEVSSAAQEVKSVARKVEGCDISQDEQAMWYAWSTASSEFEDGTIGFAMPAEPESGIAKPGGVGFSVAEVSTGLVVAVSVYALESDDPNLETVEIYADQIARNQVDANSDTPPTPVGALADIESPITGNPDNPVVPPVGESTYDGDLDEIS